MKNLTDKTLAQMCLDAAALYKNHLALAMFSEGQVTKRVTYTQFGNLSLQLGSLLRSLGVKNGGKVMLISDNCPEWGLTYFGISLAGAVSVPLLTGFSAEQIKHISEHSEVCAICLSKSVKEKIAPASYPQIPLIYIDTITSNDEDAKVTISVNGEEKQVQFDPVKNCSNHFENNPDALASIIYTSGTQGSSKGVMLTSRNILSSTFSATSFIQITPKDKFLSVLPLAHSYECGLGLLTPLDGGASITYLDRPPSASVLLPAAKSVRPTAMLAVPLMIEKIYNSSIAPKLKDNKLFKFPLTRPLAVRVAGKKLNKALGGRIRFFGIGGAPLKPAVEEFLHKARFPYCIGYGLTETSPLNASNTPLKFKYNTGLKTVKGVTIKIDKSLNPNRTDGEILIKGPNVMMGYYKDKERTTEAFTSDGWLRTGDLGWVEGEDRVHIRGRLKALILGPSGENIYPEEIEGLLGSNQLVEDALVYSGKRGELIALIRLSDTAKAAADAVEQMVEELRTWANQKLAAFSR
ncbi:MAG: AMP-binding protein, partial [Treponema sp.]|nr:AMP-binding protein [Treponema sp.]